MVAFTTLAVALSAVGAAVAAPEGLRGYEGRSEQVAERGLPNFTLDYDHPFNIARRNLTARSNTNYVQNYHTGGTVNFNSGTNQFTLNYNVQQDFVVGVGWQPGSTA
jgi:endo-1,4-beta-xylanase